jgi:hypothetical protein
MRFALNYGLVMPVLAAMAVTSSSFTACAQNLPAPQPIAQVITATGASPVTDPATGRHAFSRTGPDRRLFFGFVEFDWDPNASGGAPGFGPLPDPTQAANR